MNPTLHNILMGVASGVTSAALGDFAAFKSWKSFDDARTYSWSLAIWRWFQGAIVGGLTGLGFGAM